LRVLFILVITKLILFRETGVLDREMDVLDRDQTVNYS
jgi:hypothetical protein